VDVGLAGKIKRSNDALNRIWKSRRYSPIAGRESKIVMAYLVAINVAPFTIYHNDLNIVGDLLPRDGEGSVNVLLGHQNSKTNKLSTTAILQCKIAIT